MKTIHQFYSVLALSVLYCTAPASAQTTQPVKPPAYTPVRYNEDYSYLRDPAQRTDFFDPIKFVPLNSDGSWYASFGGEIRDRYEYFNNNLFGKGAEDNDGYNLLRFMASANVHFGPNIRVFVQGIDASVQGNDNPPRPVDVDNFDFEQAFIDFKIPFADQTSFTVRGGRQNLLFGAQRLIGPLDWANTRRTFDGFRGTLASPGNNLDMFFVEPVMPTRYQLDSVVSHDQFGGLYDTWQVSCLPPADHAQLEAYALYLGHEVATFPAEGKGREQRYTVGTRLSANPKPFDFDLEPDYQFGDFNSGNISAYSIASEAGYTFSNLDFVPRIFAGFDDASGDRSPSHGGLNTFNQLFPTGHLFYGYTDVIGRQNIIDLRGGFDVQLLKNHEFAQLLTLRSEYHQLWRNSGEDAIFSSAGAITRATAADTSNSVGSVLALMLNWQVDRHLSAYMGYSHFFAGKFIEQTGPHSDIDFLYAAMTYKF